jgi:hypothetical protein
MGRNLVGEIHRNRRAILDIVPTNDSHKWFNIRQGYGMHALPAFLTLPSKKAVSLQSPALSLVLARATAPVMNPLSFDDASNR